MRKRTTLKISDRAWRLLLCITTKGGKMLLNPSDWAFEYVAMGGITFVAFVTAGRPYRFPEREEKRFIADNLGDASELIEHVFEVRSLTIANELKRLGFVHGSAGAKSLLQYLEAEGYLNPPSDIDD